CDTPIECVSPVVSTQRGGDQFALALLPPLQLDPLLAGGLDLLVGGLDVYVIQVHRRLEIAVKAIPATPENLLHSGQVGSEAAVKTSRRGALRGASSFRSASVTSMLNRDGLPLEPSFISARRFWRTRANGADRPG